MVDDMEGEWWMPCGGVVDDMEHPHPLEHVLIKPQ